MYEAVNPEIPGLKPSNPGIEKKSGIPGSRIPAGIAIPMIADEQQIRQIYLASRILSANGKFQLKFD
jgi:hypothetical protein